MDRQTSLTAKRFASALKKRMNVNRLILFGSRARGDHFVTSDFDFVLLSGEFSGKPFTRRASQLYKFWQSSCDLEVLCYRTAETYRADERADAQIAHTVLARCPY